MAKKDNKKSNTKGKEKIVKKGKKQESFSFPKNLLVPVAEFLQNRLKALQINKSKISSEDPFKNKARVLDNASPDADAEEQFGHARVDAIKNELNDKMSQIKKALKRIKKGKYGICEDCGKMIDTDRLGVYPEATLCASCKSKREK